MRGRIAAAVAAGAVTVVSLSGCMFVTPQQTARSYTPSDGVNGHVGAVDIRNAFLVTGDGTSANLIAALANTTRTPRTVTMQYTTTSGAKTVRVVVPADGLVSLQPSTAAQDGSPASEQDRQIVLEGITATRGGLFPVGFSSGGSQPATLQLPVLTNSLPDYRTLTPAPSTAPTGAQPSDEPTPLPTDTSPSPDSSPGP